MASSDFPFGVARDFSVHRLIPALTTAELAVDQMGSRPFSRVSFLSCRRFKRRGW